MSTIGDASSGGACFCLKHPVTFGQVLLLSLPIPKNFRQYDLSEPSYRTYALVRNLAPLGDTYRVGVLFLGKNPPRDFEKSPSGLYLLPKYPDWSVLIPEVARQLSPDSNLIPNTKSLYVRLLAETGLPGFWLFVVFFVSFLAIILRMHASGTPFLRFVAVAGLFGWFGIALRNLTQDSFTIPIMWVMLGMVVGLVPVSPRVFRPKGGEMNYR